MMTCSPLPRPEDLKPLVKTAIQIVTTPEDVDGEYAAIAFCVAPGEQGGGAYFLLGLSPGCCEYAITIANTRNVTQTLEQ